MRGRERYMADNEEEGGGCMKIMIILMTMMFMMMMTVIFILVMILTMMMLMMILIIIFTMGIIVYLYLSIIDTRYASFNMLHTECIFPSAIWLINMFIAATVRNTLYVSLAAHGLYSSLYTYMQHILAQATTHWTWFKRWLLLQTHWDFDHYHETGCYCAGLNGYWGGGGVGVCGWVCVWVGGIRLRQGRRHSINNNFTKDRFPYPWIWLLYLVSINSACRLP